MTILDFEKSRPIEGGPSFSLGNRITRVVWSIAWLLLARWTPRAMYPWRNWLARCFGARIGPGAIIYGSTKIWLPANLDLGAGATLGPRVNCYSMALIRIGRNTIVSQGAHLCAGTHDYRDPNFQLLARSIEVGERVWVAAEAFVGPGVVIGDGAVLGARACAMRELAPWTVYSGNPATAVGAREVRTPPSRAAAR